LSHPHLRKQCRNQYHLMPWVEKYDSIMRNNVWGVVPRPVDKSVVSSIWIYEVNKATYGSAEKYKARFLAIGLS